MRIPSVHQSTAAVWPCALMTSGAIYSRKLQISPLHPHRVHQSHLHTFCTNKRICSKVRCTRHGVNEGNLESQLVDVKRGSKQAIAQTISTHPILRRLDHHWHTARLI